MEPKPAIDGVDKAGHQPANERTRVALVDVLDFINRDDCEHLGLASIAACLRERTFTVDLFSIVTGESTEQLAGDHSRRYALYGFSIYPNTAFDVIRQANAIKDRYPDTLICVGGQLATAAAAEILREARSIDFCVLGDGECPVMDVAFALASGNSLDSVRSVFKRDFAIPAEQLASVELATLPLPVRDFFEFSTRRGNNTARINSSLGCAASCTFCSVNGYYDAELTARKKPVVLPVVSENSSPRPSDPASSKRKKWRARTVADVFEEICHLNRNLGVRSFVFNDASFEDPGRVGKERIRRFCGLVKESGLVLAFRCAIRAESFKSPEDEEILDLMRTSGFTHIFVGIEAGNPRDLKTFQKMATVEDNERIIGLLKRHDIDLTMGFIMLNPFSTLDGVRENHRFLVRNRAFILNHYIGKVHVYFGTSLHKDLLQAGLLADEFSYRNPYGYRFAEPGMHELDTFLEEVRSIPSVGKQTGRMYSLSYKLSELRALFPIETPPVIEEFSSICQGSASLLASYFDLPFENGDLAQARRELPAFASAVEEECKRLESFSLRLVYNRAFRDYFLGFGPKRRIQSAALKPVFEPVLPSSS